MFAAIPPGFVARKQTGRRLSPRFILAMICFSRTFGYRRYQEENVNSSMLARLDAEANDGFLAKRLCSLQTVQALDQHKAHSVGPHQDRCFLALVEHTRSDFVRALL